MQLSSTFFLITCAVSVVLAMPQPGAENKVPGLFKRADNCRSVDPGSPCMKCSGGVCSVMRYSTGEETLFASPRGE
ncbi:hypothetical protein FPQ18DRAFT_128195 [Pyronema domesticum]|nr:hypothetical protein FPQ18DRAFT_128195 [Pyronema domesticum]